MSQEHDSTTTQMNPVTTVDSDPVTEPTRSGRCARTGAMVLLLVSILAGALAVGGSPASAASPRVDAYCQSYNGGVFTVGTDDDHAIFMAVERRTSTGWKLVGYSQGGSWGGWQWRSNQVTRDLWGNTFGAGRYRVTAWTYNFGTGAVVGHEPHRVVHWENPGGYAGSSQTHRSDCRVTLP